MFDRLKRRIAQLGAWVSRGADSTGFGLILLLEAIASIGALRRRTARRALAEQLFICGFSALPVTLVVSLFIGMILALNGGLTLQQIGQETLIGQVVSVSMIREMGPFMTALILAASVGSAMAAEIGTMTVSEEIDAMRVMAIDPARFLVLPRLLAMAVMCPIITAYSDLIGIVGAAIVSRAQLGVSFRIFKNEAISSLVLKDIETGFFKALVFGVVIAIVGCTQGLRAAGGAIGVGHATRRSVVISYILVIMLGYYITWIFYR